MNLLSPALTDIQERFEKPLVIDVGAGKAYLGFILYELYFKTKSEGRILSIESRRDLMERAQAMAKRLDFGRMDFVNDEVRNFKGSDRVHLLTALHACDTATDEALILGVRSQADHIAVVPCCQAEAARLLQGEKKYPMGVLWEHGIHRREFGSHFTNVVRALTLEALGYSVTVTELVGWSTRLKTN